MRTFILIAALGSILALTVWGFFSGWAGLDWNLGLHGWIALTLGVVLTCALGGGLMALSFYSSRAGYDDRIAPDATHESNDLPGDADR
jgi:hypothetical protein